MPATRQHHVALIVETATIYGRRLLQGIGQFARTHGPWSIFLEQRGLTESVPEWLYGWQGDGIISRVTTPELAEHLLTMGKPTVDLTDVHGEIGLPRIWSDDVAIGRLAGEHLRERGFRHFAFCGFSDHHWSNRRREGFSKSVASSDGTICHPYESPWGGPDAHRWEDEQTEIANWLRALPKPIGIMASNDMRGQHVLDACTRSDVVVPEEVAVVGCDDDEVLCELSNPPLSSVIPNPQRIGFEAAELLHDMMTGRASTQRKLSQVRRSISPIGVTTRQSTDVLAIEDPQIAAAVHYIREHACSGLNVGQLLSKVDISRSMLERGFRRFVHRTPHAEIRHVQLKRVCQLLGETELPLNQIAELTGFNHPEYLSVVFKREMLETPGRYRQRATAQR